RRVGFTRQRDALQNGARQRIDFRCRDLVPLKGPACGRVDDGRERLAGERVESAEVPSAERSGRQERGVGDALAHAETLAVSEKERSIAADGAPFAPAELVLAKRRNRSPGIIKEILCIDGAVAQELVSRPGKPVCAEARGDADLGARGESLLRRIRVLE